MLQIGERGNRTTHTNRDIMQRTADSHNIYYYLFVPGEVADFLLIRVLPFSLCITMDSLLCTMEYMQYHVIKV